LVAIYAALLIANYPVKVLLDATGVVGNASSGVIGRFSDTFLGNLKYSTL